MGSNAYYVKPENLQNLKLQSSISRLIKTKIDFHEYKDAIISIDNLCCFVNGVVMKNSLFYEHLNTKKAPNKADCKNELSNCIFIGCLASTWGHWITDTLKKIWYLRTDDYKKKLSQGWLIVYITLNDGGYLSLNHKMSSNQKELLELAGVDASSWLEITENTIVHNIVIPDNSLISTKNEGMYYTKEFKETIHLITDSVPTISDYEKVYFTRTSFKSIKDFGEEKIEAFFAKMGYRIIAPEKLSVKEQISILKSCNFFAACESSASHNAIFCQNGTNVAILRKGDYINNYTLLINQVADLNVTFIDAHNSEYINKHKPEFGPFFMFVTKHLKAWAGVKQIGLPYWLTKTWFQYVFFCKHNKTITQTKLYLCLRYPRYLLGHIKQKISKLSI